MRAGPKGRKSRFGATMAGRKVDWLIVTAYESRDFEMHINRTRASLSLNGP